MSEQLYCDVPECDDPKNPGFPCPAFRNGKCSTHTKQLQRNGRTTAIKPTRSLKEQLIDEAGRLVEADDNHEYDTAERNVVAVAKRLGRAEIGAAIAAGLRRARQQGKPIGRSPKAERAAVLATFQEVVQVVGTAKAAEIAARLHHISRRTVFRYLAVTKGRLLSPPRLPSPPGGPRLAG